MKGQRIVGLAFVGLLSAGCFSMGSNATNPSTVSETRTSTPTASSTPTPKGSQTPPANTKMTEPNQDKPFPRSLPADFTQPTDDAGKLLLREYGSVFVAKGGAIAAKKVVFKDEADVKSFQSSLKRSSESIGGFNVELQTPAMTAVAAHSPATQL